MLEITNELLIIIIILIAFEFILLGYTLYDWMKQGKTLENRMVWLVVIVLVSTIGPILYFLLAPREKHDSFLDDNRN